MGLDHLIVDHPKGKGDISLHKGLDITLAKDLHSNR